MTSASAFGEGFTQSDHAARAHCSPRFRPAKPVDTQGGRAGVDIAKKCDFGPRSGDTPIIGVRFQTMRLRHRPPRH